MEAEAEEGEEEACEEVMSEHESNVLHIANESTSTSNVIKRTTPRIL